MKKRVFTGTVGRTMAETRYKYRMESNEPQNAPNVVYIVLDDMGFAQLGCYGSTIHTPNIDRLAYEGLRYNNFHTTDAKKPYASNVPWSWYMVNAGSMGSSNLFCSWP